MDIILASTSPYRQRLLARLELPFNCVPPDVDESPRPNEAPDALACRLARAKAAAVAIRYPDAVVIGSDQVAAVDGCVIGKPGTFERAVAQLELSSGRDVCFFTAVAVNALGSGLERFHVELYTARFRTLTRSQIEHYLHREQPYDCAGSFKVEGLGIALLEQLTGTDPTSLEGLPLIKLTELLAAAGIDVLRGVLDSSH